MIEVGACKARAHLPKLLDRVARGERITITRHGVPMAVLVPVSASGQRPTAEIARELQELREGRTLADVSLREAIDEGRE